MDSITIFLRCSSELASLSDESHAHGENHKPGRVITNKNLQLNAKEYW